MSYIIRRMTKAELDFAVEQAAKEGWNPGLDDAEVFYETDPNGFFIGLLDNRPVSSISAVSYGKDFAFIGFYIVLPEFRGQHYGFQLGQTALAYLKETRAVGLDGVLAQQENYQRAGFQFAYHNIRYEYKITAPVCARQTSAIVSATNLDINEVIRYDRQCFPADRKTFLEKWFAMKHANACGWVEGGQLKGYGVIRKCRSGYKIGPLFADNGSIAKNIFLQLCSFVEAPTPVYLDVPEVNSAGIELAKTFGMQPVFKTARMYLGPQPDIQLDKIFGVTSFELG